MGYSILNWDFDISNLGYYVQLRILSVSSLVREQSPKSPIGINIPIEDIVYPMGDIIPNWALSSVSPLLCCT